MTETPEVKKRNRTSKESKYYVTNAELYEEMVNYERTGSCSENLGRLIILLVEKYATHPWFNGWSYKEEMMGNAILMIYQKLDKFDLHTFSFKIDTNVKIPEEELIKHCNDVVGEYGQYNTYDLIMKTDEETGEESLIGISVIFTSDLFLDDLQSLLGDRIKARYYNVHAYFTKIARNEFQKYKKVELKQRMIRDEILIDNDMEPSYNYDSDSYVGDDSECIVTTY